ncbi:MAG: acyltransferase, partial [Hyphomicrobiales bacterium]|nr:acyltransferase [Hyphomicrobiales bacterium]
PLIGIAALAVWATVNGALVWAGAASWPVVSLALGFAGVGAIIAASTLLAQSRALALVAATLSWLGAHSIVVYLAFFLPMAVTRIVLLKTGIVPDLGTVALLVTAAAVIGPLLFHFIITRLGILGFLFARPGWARIPPAPREPKLVPAE